MALNQSNTKTNKPNNSQKIQSNGIFAPIGFIKNVIYFFITGLFLLTLIKGNVGYSWVANDLIYENLKYFYKYPFLTNTQKLESKFGMDATVIQKIKKATPENAIIWMPPEKILFSENTNYPFMPGTGGIKNRNWTLYFLYPRQLIYADEAPKLQNLIDKATHVVCLNGWGYDKLYYDVEPTQDLQILKLKK